MRPIDDDKIKYINEHDIFIISVSSSLRDKFLKYLKRTFPKHIISKQDLRIDTQFNPLRYRYYNDRNRYPYEKFIKCVAKTYEINFVCLLDGKLGALFKIKYGHVTEEILRDYFINEWHANIHEGNNGNYIIGNLCLKIKKVNTYGSYPYYLRGMVIDEVTDKQLLENLIDF